MRRGVVVAGGALALALAWTGPTVGGSSVASGWQRPAPSGAARASSPRLTPSKLVIGRKYRGPGGPYLSWPACRRAVGARSRYGFVIPSRNGRHLLLRKTIDLKPLRFVFDPVGIPGHPGFADTLRRTQFYFLVSPFAREGKTLLTLVCRRATRRGRPGRVVLRRRLAVRFVRRPERLLDRFRVAPGQTQTIDVSAGSCAVPGVQRVEIESEAFTPNAQGRRVVSLRRQETDTPSLPKFTGDVIGATDRPFGTHEARYSCGTGQIGRSSVSLEPT